jgi:hypothetical protein
MDQVERAKAGDTEALRDLEEKYPAFFQEGSSSTNLQYLEEYIRHETAANPASSSESEDDSPENPESTSENGYDSPENPVSPNVPIPTVNSSNLEEELSYLEVSEVNPSNDEVQEDSSVVSPIETKPSAKRARSESTTDLESSDRKKTKTKKDDDDDSNDNPPKGGGNIGGLPPMDGGDSNSGQGSSSSNSMTKFEIILINLGLVLEEILKNIFPPF